MGSVGGEAFFSLKRLHQPRQQGVNRLGKRRQLTHATMTQRRQIIFMAGRHRPRQAGQRPQSPTNRQSHQNQYQWHAEQIGRQDRAGNIAHQGMARRVAFRHHHPALTR